ncbi:MAG: hypothetical protein R2910_13190 [Gemmatimonadales bacterium]
MPRRPSLRPVFVVLATLGTLAAGRLTAQQPKVPVQRLTKPDATFDEPFTQVAGLRELKNGDVIVADMRDRTLQKIDLKKGTATAISREGSGPTEYLFPTGVYPFPGDSTAVYDMGNQRYLLLDPTGKPISTFRMDEGNSGGGMMILRAASGADDRGRLYYSTRGERRGGGLDGGPPEFSDSGRVVRYDRATKKFDTLGVVMVPKPNVQASGSSNNRSISIRPAPMAPEDAWGVAPDGRIGVARIATDEVQWWLPDGKRVTGPPVRYSPVKVTDADKKAWQEQAARGGIMVNNENGKMTVSPAPSTPRPIDPSIEWPATKPAFPANAVRVAPNGELWELRSTPATDPLPLYYVFDGTGKLVKEVRLPAESRIVAFGKNVVYLVRRDADDLEYLERYRL